MHANKKNQNLLLSLYLCKFTDLLRIVHKWSLSLLISSFFLPVTFATTRYLKKYYICTEKKKESQNLLIQIYIYIYIYMYI